MKVWVVTEGEYSDRSVEAVYDSEEKAIAHVAACDVIGRAADYSEFVLNTRNDAQTLRRVHLCKMECRSGNAVTFEAEVVASALADRGRWEGRQGFTDFYVYGWSAASADEATKLAAEARQEWLRESDQREAAWEKQRQQERQMWAKVMERAQARDQGVSS